MFPAKRGRPCNLKVYWKGAGFVNTQSHYFFAVNRANRAFFPKFQPKLMVYCPYITKVIYICNQKHFMV